MAKRSNPNGDRVYGCRCRRGSFHLVANESPKYKKCPRCLAKEQAELYQRVFHLAVTRGQRRMVRRLSRVTADLMAQVLRQP